MSATIKQTKTLSTLDLAIRTLKPRTQASETSEKQDARVVIVTNF